MKTPSRWALASSALAPVSLIGGWTVAAGRQPAGFDSVRDTISALAAHGATDRWLMTSALAVTGVCHLVTAAGTSAAAPVGRTVLAVAGIASIGVAAFAQGVGGTNTPGHAVAAGIAFGALTVFPVLATRPSADAPLLTRRAGAVATVVLGATLVWFGAELTRDGAALGLSERALAAAQVLWPLALTVTTRRAAARASTRGSRAAVR